MQKIVHGSFPVASPVSNLIYVWSLDDSMKGARLCGQFDVHPFHLRAFHPSATHCSICFPLLWSRIPSRCSSSPSSSIFSALFSSRSSLFNWRFYCSVLVYGFWWFFQVRFYFRLNYFIPFQLADLLGQDYFIGRFIGLPKITFRGAKFLTQVYTSFRQNSISLIFDICGSDVNNISYFTFDIRLFDRFNIRCFLHSLRDKFDIHQLIA